MQCPWSRVHDSEALSRKYKMSKSRHTSTEPAPKYLYVWQRSFHRKYRAETIGSFASWSEEKTVGFTIFNVDKPFKPSTPAVVQIRWSTMAGILAALSMLCVTSLPSLTTVSCVWASFQSNQKTHSLTSTSLAFVLVLETNWWQGASRTSNLQAPSANGTRSGRPPDGGVWRKLRSYRRVGERIYHHLLFRTDSHRYKKAPLNQGPTTRSP